MVLLSAGTPALRSHDTQPGSHVQCVLYMLPSVKTTVV
jgi:hypothetical protein